MEELLKNIDEQIAAFQADSKLQQKRGNKAAGTRARKASLALEKLLKEFRRESIHAVFCFLFRRLFVGGSSFAHFIVLCDRQREVRNIDFLHFTPPMSERQTGIERLTFGFA